METAPIPTIAELGEEVLADRDAQGVRGAARERSRFRTHILPSALANMRVNEVAPRHIREWLRWMAQRPAQVRTGEAPRHLDRQTIKRAQSLISVILAEAVERDIIEMNPCLSVKQKKIVNEGDTIEQWAYLTPAEQKLLFECEAVPRHLRLAAAVAVHTGMRMGEQSNLELVDLRVDGSDPHVLIRYSNPHKGKRSPPKSGKRRRVPLFGAGLDAARTWLDFLPSFAPKNPLGLVFPTARGMRRPEGKICGRAGTMRPFYKAAGIELRPHLVWHSLRHTYATNLITGVYGRAWRIEEIQVVMGHSSVTITQRYAHLGEDAIAKAARETVAAAMPVAPNTMPTLPPDTLRDLNAVFDDDMAVAS